MRDKRKLNGFREGTKEKRDARGIPAKLLSRNTRFFFCNSHSPWKIRIEPSAVAHAPWSTRWRCRRAPGGTRAGPRGISSEQTRRWCVSTRARRSLRARSVPSRGPQQAFSRLARATPRDPRASTSTAPLPAQRARGVSARHPDSVPTAPDCPRPPPAPPPGRDAPPLTPRRAHRTHHLPRTLPRGRRRSRRRARPPTDRRPGR